jgi:hypothetical protein
VFVLDDYALPKMDPQPLSQQVRRKRKKGSFLKGPVPIGWLSAAAQLPGKTLHVAVSIWFAHGVHGQRRFRLTTRWLAWSKIGPKALSKSLHRLREAGLIGLEYRPGCAPIVVLLDAPELDTDRDSRG